MSRCLALAPLLVAGSAAAIAAQDDRSHAKLSAPGPHAVGVRTVVLVDESRRDPLTGDHRTLVTEIWYPAAETARGGAPTKFVQFFGEHADAAAQFAAHFGGEIEAVNARFRSIGVRDAPRREGRYPLLVFSHGNGGVRHQSVFQTDHLASHGYVVASCDHTGNAGVTPLPGKAIRYDRKGRGRSAADRPRDVSFMIDRLLAASADPDSWLAGGLDAARIGVLGHSFGGLTACKVAERDRRVRAILPMTVAIGKPATIPVLVMLGGRDRTVHDAGNRLSGTYYRVSDGPKHLVVLKRAGHFSFSDMDRINPEFGDGIGRDADTGEPFLDIDRAKRIINGYSVAFFDGYLKGDAAALQALQGNVAPDELQVESANLELAGK